MLDWEGAEGGVRPKKERRREEVVEEGVEEREEAVEEEEADEVGETELEDGLELLA